MQIECIDHLVLTVENIGASCDFYEKILGMQALTFQDGRRAVAFGNQKINLHQAGKEFEPKALRPTPGSADLCFITPEPIAEVSRHLRTCGVEILAGPVERTGASGPIVSIYIRDPDQNLIEISNYILR